MEDNDRIVKFDDWNIFNQQLQKESDRGIVLVSAELISVLLQELLAKKFLSDSRIGNILFNQPGSSLSSFYSKIELSFAMGLISDDEYHDLQIVRKVRNQFAHSFDELHFSTEVIAKEITKLKIPSLSKYSETKEMKRRFVNGVSMLATFINKRIGNSYEIVNKPRRIIMVDRG